MTEHRVEVDGASVHDAAFHTFAGLELLAVETLIIKETVQTVQLSIATHILKYVREVVDQTAHGKQHTIAIELVAAGQRTVANLAGSEQNVLAVHHHDGVVAGLRHGVVVQCDMVLQELFDGAVVFVVNLTFLGMIGSNEFVGLFLGETTVGRRKDGERLCRGQRLVVATCLDNATEVAQFRVLLDGLPQRPFFYALCCPVVVVVPRVGAGSEGEGGYCQPHHHDISIFSFHILFSLVR